MMAQGSDEKLATVLGLAKRAFEAEKSDRWGADPAVADARHSEACNALWDELRRLVYEADGVSVRMIPTPAEIRARAGRQVIEHLQRRLPELIEEIGEAPIDDDLFPAGAGDDGGRRG